VKCPYCEYDVEEWDEDDDPVYVFPSISKYKCGKVGADMKGNNIEGNVQHVYSLQLRSQRYFPASLTLSESILMGQGKKRAPRITKKLVRHPSFWLSTDEQDETS